MITEKIGLPAMLEQTAEECTELAHACQKLARIYRGNNPTPVTERDASDAIEEETADVMICVDELTRAGVIQLPTMRVRMQKKLDRARERLGI